MTRAPRLSRSISLSRARARAIALAVTATAFAIALVVLGVACGGNLRATDTLDACATTHDGGDAADVVSEDAPPWWYDVFDAATYTGFSPPIPGEYPPNGPGVCIHSGCFVSGVCDPETGWCCGGKTKRSGCACGDDAGCVPPAICCALPGQLQMRCVATPDQCPGLR